LCAIGYCSTGTSSKRLANESGIVSMGQWPPSMDMKFHLGASLKELSSAASLEDESQFFRAMKVDGSDESGLGSTAGSVTVCPGCPMSLDARKST
jgi:ribonuclease HIII